jgi:hypothetical protein
VESGRGRRRLIRLRPLIRRESGKLLRTLPVIAKFEAVTCTKSFSELPA